MCCFHRRTPFLFCFDGGDRLFRLVDLEIRYGELEVLKGFNLSAEKDEFLCLFGPSGVGKTTILNTLAGLIVPTRGKREMSLGRIGYVFQEPRLIPWCSVSENIALSLYSLALPRKERDRIVKELIAKLELEGFENHYPNQLSGGMRQRVALGRAFAIEPDILLLDEPFSALDENLKCTMRQLLLDLIIWKPCTCVFITHDANEAARVGDRIVILEGRPCQKVKEIRLDLPRDRRDQAFFSQVEHEIKTSAIT